MIGIRKRLLSMAYFSSALIWVAQVSGGYVGPQAVGLVPAELRHPPGAVRARLEVVHGDAVRCGHVDQDRSGLHGGEEVAPGQPARLGVQGRRQYHHICIAQQPRQVGDRAGLVDGRVGPGRSANHRNPRPERFDPVGQRLADRAAVLVDRPGLQS